MHRGFLSRLDDAVGYAFFLRLFYVVFRDLEADAVLPDLLHDLPLRHLVIQHVPDLVHAQRTLALAHARGRLGIAHQVSLLLELDLDRAQRVFRGPLIPRSHQHYIVAGPVNVGARFLDDLDSLDPRHLLRRAGIDAQHLAVRVWRAQYLAVQHPRTLGVVGVTRAPGNFVGRIHPQRAVANQSSILRIRPLIVSHGLSSLLRGSRDGGAYSPVGAAAANVAAQSVQQIFCAGIGILVEYRFAGHHKPRGAEAALRRIVVDEGLLNRVQLAFLRQRFNREDLAALGLNRQHRAGIHWAVVEHHRAGAAFALVADPLRAGQIESVPQRVQQRNPRLQHRLHLAAVDSELHRDLARPVHVYLLAGGQHRRRRRDHRDRGGD